jgi:hypothetical protein
MATWTIEPTWKKSLVEVEHYHKDGKTVEYETGWRWGTFYCETEDDNPPDINDGDDLYDCGYDVELQETTDGCWAEYRFSENISDEEREELEEFFEENSAYDLESLGWVQGDTQMFIQCEPEITKVDE